MVACHLNGRLIIAIIATTLSFSFFGDPSIPLRIKDLSQLERPFHEKGYSSEDQDLLIFRQFFTPSTVTDGCHSFAHVIGLVFAWPVAERYGRKRGLLYTNIFRFFGIFLHFSATIYGTVYFSLNDDTTGEWCAQFANTNSSSSTTTTLSHETKAPYMMIGISVLSKLVDGFHSGLSTVLGILYVFELAPKSSTISSLSIMAFYMFMKLGAEYIVSLTVPPMLYNPMNYWVWTTSGILSLLAGLGQIALLVKFCSEPPSFLALQKKNTEEAKNVLRELRGTDQVDEELEEIEKDQSQRKSSKRTMYLAFLYLLFTIYNAVFLFIGFLHGLALGIPLRISVNVYLIINIFSHLIPIVCFNNLSLFKLRAVLFCYYWILGLLYFANSVVATINMEISKSIFQSNQIAAAIVVAGTVVTSIVFSSGPGIITVVMINEYTCQRKRARTLILSWLFGILLTTKALAFFSFVFIKALLMFYLFKPLPWIFIGVITWYVWTEETVHYGAVLVDGNGNSQENPNRNPAVVDEEKNEQGSAAVAAS